MTLVSKDERQKSFHFKAKELGDWKVPRKIQGLGDSHIDMVADDFKYHFKSMDEFINRRSKQRWQ